VTLIGRTVHAAALALPVLLAGAIVVGVFVGWGSLPAIVLYVLLALCALAILGYIQAVKRVDGFHRAEISRGLTRAFNGDRVVAEERPLEELRIAIVSDLHKGTRDGADDFWRCERAYRAAIAHYLEEGYRLVVLGDAEELWECDAPDVIECYRELLDIEAELHADGRYLRIWGNHDIDWRKPRLVQKHLSGTFGPDIAVHEALRIEVTAGGAAIGTLFLTHGHQGTADSELFALYSRPFVRGFGLLQRGFNKPWNTPATDNRLRARHDKAMFEWARSKDHPPLVLIAGHTHRPIYWDETPPVPPATRISGLAHRLDAARHAGAPPEQLAELHAALEYARGEQRWQTDPPEPVEPPCYFNTGCCAFSDGDITAIEIADGEIRLVRFPDDDSQPHPKLLSDPPAKLADVFARVGSGQPAALTRT
jgi:predicted phosphodiesterase